MPETAARSLRTAERYLLAPPLPAVFGSEEVAVCDISAKGARFKHARPVETGSKSLLRLSLEGQLATVSLESAVIWTQADASQPGQFVTGVRTYGSPETVDRILTHLKSSHRSNRIEELRSTDRFFVAPSLPGSYDGVEVAVENLSARGARIATATEVPVGSDHRLWFRAVPTEQEVSVNARVVWSGVKSVSDPHRYRAGLVIAEKPELLRLIIGQLCELDRCALDTQSLRLKLKILRARARQQAPAFGAVESAGIPAEQYLLIQGVREELRLNPEEALHWYRQARLTIADPATHATAAPIESHPDALAVWEYLDRSIDPTIVGRAFALPR